MSPKYKLIKERIIAQITSGQYRLGEQIPTCRELAEQWNVSYMTINKVLNLLAAENYLDLKHGQGIFVRWRPYGAFPSERRVQLFPLATTHPLFTLYLDTAQRELRRLGWRITLKHCESIAETIECIRDKSQYSLLFGFQLTDPEDIAALCAAGRERLVMIGERYECFGISSSCVDSSQAIRLAVNHLRSLGRSNLALICSNLKHPDEAEYAAIWRSLTEEFNPDIDCAELLWNIKLDQMSAPRAALTRLLEEKAQNAILQHVDGIICTDDEKAVIVESFCYDQKIHVPKELALVTINESGLAEIVRPRLTTIDTALPRQIGNAIRMLEDKVSGHFDGLLLRTAEPKLHCRESAPAIPGDGAK